MDEIISKSVESLLQITVQNCVTDFIQANSAFRLQAGKPSTVVRVTSGKCCKWCSQVAGTYVVGVDDIYNIDGKGHSVFQRHENCDCLVTWHDYKGIRNVHSKEFYTRSQYVVEKTKIFSLTDNENVKDLLTQYIREAAKKKGDAVVIPYGFDLKKHKDEISMASFIKERLGGVIELLKESTINGQKMPDYLWDGKYWELKSPQGMNGVNKLCQKALKQIGANLDNVTPGGIIMDITHVNSPLSEIEKRLSIRVEMSKFFDKPIDIIIVKNNKIIKINRYK